MPPPEAGAPGAAALVGWDVGGAHLKACLWQDGRVRDVRQMACALWQGMPRLDAAIEALGAAGPHWASALGDSRTRHAVTMSGEMADCFADRAEGVAGIAGHLAARFGPGALAFYGGPAGWLGPRDAAGAWSLIASANWRASAEHAARAVGSGLWIDIGSTTTDLVVLREGQVLSDSRDDADRLSSGELVYQGVVRTPLCALADRIELDGREFNVMHEWFATSADVYRLTGELDPAHDQHPAADQGAKDEAGSARRLARMVGHDAPFAELRRWRRFAERWRERQLDRIAANLARVLDRHALPDGAPFVVAGCGAFLARELATATGRPSLDYGRDVAAATDARRAEAASLCAPAVAVAALLDGPR